MFIFEYYHFTQIIFTQIILSVIWAGLFFHLFSEAKQFSIAIVWFHTRENEDT